MKSIFVAAVLALAATVRRPLVAGILKLSCAHDRAAPRPPAARGAAHRLAAGPWHACGRPRAVAGQAARCAGQAGRPSAGPGNRPSHLHPS